MLTQLKVKLLAKQSFTALRNTIADMLEQSNGLKENAGNHKRKAKC